MKQQKMTDSLVIVKKQKLHPGSIEKVVLPRELLRERENQQREHYFIHDLQEFSAGFPDNENIYILGHQVAENFPLHNHDFFELTYVCQGEMINIIDGCRLYMGQGDITLLNQQALQEIHCINPDTLIVNVCMKETLFDGTLKHFTEADNPLSKFLRHQTLHNQKYMFFSMGNRSGIPLFMNHMLEAYIQAEFHQTFSMEAWLLLLLDCLAKSGRFSYTGIDDNALRILRYVQEQCIGHTLEEMAADLGYNANYLTGYIKKHTGRSSKDIMKEARLKKALSLLEETDLSIYEISEACGYSSPSHFFRIFKETHGMTPKEFRSSL